MVLDAFQLSFHWKAILAGRGFCHHAHGMATCNSSWCQLKLQPSATVPEELKGLPCELGDFDSPGFSAPCPFEQNQAEHDQICTPDGGKAAK